MSDQGEPNSLRTYCGTPRGLRSTTRNDFNRFRAFDTARFGFGVLVGSEARGAGVEGVGVGCEVVGAGVGVLVRGALVAWAPVGSGSAVGEDSGTKARAHPETSSATKVAAIPRRFTRCHFPRYEDYVTTDTSVNSDKTENLADLALFADPVLGHFPLGQELMQLAG